MVTKWQKLACVHACAAEVQRHAAWFGRVRLGAVVRSRIASLITLARSLSPSTGRPRSSQTGARAFAARQEMRVPCAECSAFGRGCAQAEQWFTGMRSDGGRSLQMTCSTSVQPRREALLSELGWAGQGRAGQTRCCSDIHVWRRAGGLTGTCCAGCVGVARELVRLTLLAAAAAAAAAARRGAA